MKTMMKTMILLMALLSADLFAKDKILVTTKGKPDFKKLYENLSNELGEDYEMVEFEVDKDTDSDDFQSKVKDVKPKLIILMDNQSVKLAKDFYKSTKSKVQSVAVMGLNYKELLKNEKNICGVAYEVPLYTSLTQFRFTQVGRKVKNVTIFYRGSLFGNMVKQGKERLKSEKINLNLIDVEKVAGDDILGYLNSKGKAIIANQKKTDAVFIMLDSVLLKKVNFIKFWLPTARGTSVPFVSGVKNFVAPKLQFAVFGMSPNLADLASQTTQMVETILDDEESCEDVGVEDLIGVNKFWNAKKAEKLGIKLNKKAAESVKVLE